MHIKKYILAIILLQLARDIQASDLLSNLTTATSNLSNATAALSNLINTSGASQGTTAAPQNNAMAMITNSSTQTVYLIMLDTNKTQINPRNISLKPGAFSYIAIGCTILQIVDVNKHPLAADINITPNYLYELTSNNNIVTVTAKPTQVTTTTYQYTNKTTTPVILAITIGSTIFTQEIASQDLYKQEINPDEIITIQVHANVSPIFRNYDPTVSYNLIIDETNKLALEKIDGSDKTIINKTGLPMFITFMTSDNQQTNLILDNEAKYQPADTTINITASCCIANSGSKPILANSCSIINNNGKLVLQF